ncbi:MAG: hypothetical protein ACK6DX_02215, partial [Acidobacteriota bacterium]
WRGWFYSTDHTDIAIDKVRLFQLDTKNPDVEKPLQRQQKKDEPITLREQRNKQLPKLLADLEEEERTALKGGSNFYVIDLRNAGGLVMPVILGIEYKDGKKEEMRIPAEIWRRNNQRVSKLLVTPKEVVSITLDPHLETADTDLSNNYWPARPVKTPFQLFKEKEVPNPMQLEKKAGSSSGN